MEPPYWTNDLYFFRASVTDSHKRPFGARPAAAAASLPEKRKGGGRVKTTAGGWPFHIGFNGWACGDKKVG